MFQLPDRKEAQDAAQFRVLVVDDEPTLRLGFTYALANRRTVVETAANGRQALEKVRSAGFDIIILDLRMPDLDGIGVIESLRNAGNSIPIVLCSAALTPHAALRAVRHGVVDFLLKPVRPVDLRQVIEFVIHPEDRPFPQAMNAARTGRPADAIRILETDTTPGRQSLYWLALLKTIRDADANDDAFSLETRIRTSLPILAFNGPAAS